MHAPRYLDARSRILFVGESCSLAHVTRPLVLAQSLDPQQYDVTFATGKDCGHLVREAGLRFAEIRCMSSETFNQRLAEGRALHTRGEVHSSVIEDLRLIAEFEPDLVVGDFRSSLYISCKVAKVPYAALSNAHWSPFSTQSFPVPDHPITKVVGTGRFARAVVGPIARRELRRQAEGFNQVCAYYDVEPLPSMREVYTRADWTLYLDLPEVAPVSAAPDNHRYLGPLVWSPDTPLPAWWDELPADRPLVYVTMGSSGDTNALRSVIAGLARLPVSVAVASAGRVDLVDLPDNVYAATYLPGSKVLERASLAVCSGGSATAYQAIAEGCPVLSIPANADQYFTAEGLEGQGAGRVIRSGQVSADQIAEVAGDLLEKERYEERAQELSERYAQLDAKQRFQSFVGELQPRRRLALVA